MGPPRKYYALTDSGRRRLDVMTQEFDTVAAALAGILKGEA